MSRTTLCVGTAALLVLVSAGLMVARHQVLGRDVRLPAGPETWKVSLAVKGKATGSARLVTALPLELPRQHVLEERCHSDELEARVSEGLPGEPREVVWTPKAGKQAGTFSARYECFCTLRPVEPGRHPHAPAPRPGDYLRSDAAIDCDHPEVSDLARQLTEGKTTPVDQAQALFQYVDQEVVNEPTVNGPARTAIECLQRGRGTPVGKSRLLAALCRNRGIPARLVVGVPLVKGSEQPVHVWVEAWLHDHWLPMCPFYHHFGRVPRTFLVLGHDDPRVVRGKSLRGLDYAFLVERAHAAGGEPSLARRFFTAVSPYALPPAERKLVEFLLLLPVAALVVCVFRNLIGLYTFGTFAPALLGLAFREVHSWIGVVVFVGVLLAGWLLRRLLASYHLLQVPRTAFMLSLVVCLLVGFVIVSNRYHLPATHYIALFPLVILTGMIERFWTLEEEDGTVASFRTLLTTLGVACCISLVLGIPALTKHLCRYPESVGIVMACQLLLGRYTGYRLTELYRFRDFIRQPTPEAVQVLSARRPVSGRRF